MQDGLTRWHLPETKYNPKWDGRNKALFELCQHLDLKKMSVIECGAGPKTPFKRLFSKYFLKIKSIDTKKWEAIDQVVDLNCEPQKIEASNLFVFSGVLEYLENPEFVLDEIFHKSDYILASYLPLNKETDVARFFRKLLRKETYYDYLYSRVNKSGIRNHYSVEEVLDLFSKYGFVESLNFYNSQILILVKMNKRR